ncbi:hypothetical protein DIPPA_55312 [Diplonema papillatum]|nr:hypothetical protein DIPPA_55312 [Diplonema papillatum]
MTASLVYDRSLCDHLDSCYNYEAATDSSDLVTNTIQRYARTSDPTENVKAHAPDTIDAHPHRTIAERHPHHGRKRTCLSPQPPEQEEHRPAAASQIDEAAKAESDLVAAIDALKTSTSTQSSWQARLAYLESLLPQVLCSNLHHKALAGLEVESQAHSSTQEADPSIDVSKCCAQTFVPPACLPFDPVYNQQHLRHRREVEEYARAVLKGKEGLVNISGERREESVVSSDNQVVGSADGKDESEDEFDGTVPAQAGLQHRINGAATKAKHGAVNTWLRGAGALPVPVPATCDSTNNEAFVITKGRSNSKGARQDGKRRESTTILQQKLGPACKIKGKPFLTRTTEPFPTADARRKHGAQRRAAPALAPLNSNAACAQRAKTGVGLKQSARVCTGNSEVTAIRRTPSRQQSQSQGGCVEHRCYVPARGRPSHVTETVVSPSRTTALTPSKPDNSRSPARRLCTSPVKGRLEVTKYSKQSSQSVWWAADDRSEEYDRNSFTRGPRKRSPSASHSPAPPSHRETVPLPIRQAPGHGTGDTGKIHLRREYKDFSEEGSPSGTPRIASASLRNPHALWKSIGRDSSQFVAPESSSSQHHSQLKQAPRAKVCSEPTASPHLDGWWLRSDVCRENAQEMAAPTRSEVPQCDSFTLESQYSCQASVYVPPSVESIRVSPVRHRGMLRGRGNERMSPPGPDTCETRYDSDCLPRQAEDAASLPVFSQQAQCPQARNRANDSGDYFESAGYHQNGNRPAGPRGDEAIDQQPTFKQQEWPGRNACNNTREPNKSELPQRSYDSHSAVRNRRTLAERKSSKARTPREVEVQGTHPVPEFVIDNDGSLGLSLPQQARRDSESASHRSTTGTQQPTPRADSWDEKAGQRRTHATHRRNSPVVGLSHPMKRLEELGFLEPLKRMWNKEERALEASRVARMTTDYMQKEAKHTPQAPFLLLPHEAAALSREVVPVVLPERYTKFVADNQHVNCVKELGSRLRRDLINADVLSESVVNLRSPTRGSCRTPRATSESCASTGWIPSRSHSVTEQLRKQHSPDSRFGSVRKQGLPTVTPPPAATPLITGKCWMRTLRQSYSRRQHVRQQLGLYQSSASSSTPEPEGPPLEHISRVRTRSAPHEPVSSASHSRPASALHNFMHQRNSQLRSSSVHSATIPGPWLDEPPKRRLIDEEVAH